MTGGKTNTRRRRKKYGVGEGWGIDVGWKEEWWWVGGEERQTKNPPHIT